MIAWNWRNINAVYVAERMDSIVPVTHNLTITLQPPLAQILRPLHASLEEVSLGVAVGNWQSLEPDGFDMITDYIREHMENSKILAFALPKMTLVR